MQFAPRAVMTETEGEAVQSAPFAVGTVGVGDVDVMVGLDAGRLTWSLANRSDRSVRVRRVAVELEARDVDGALRMFRHGYQSWSPCDTAVVGVDGDPSVHVPELGAFLGAYHADQRPAGEREIRSEWVTVLADGRSATLLGAVGGRVHDVTFRARLDDVEFESVDILPAVERVEYGGKLVSRRQDVLSVQIKLAAGEERLHDRMDIRLQDTRSFRGLQKRSNKCIAEILRQAPPPHTITRVGQPVVWHIVPGVNGERLPILHKGVHHRRDSPWHGAMRKRAQLDGAGVITQEISVT